MGIIYIDPALSGADKIVEDIMRDVTKLDSEFKIESTEFERRYHLGPHQVVLQMHKSWHGCEFEEVCSYRDIAFADYMSSPELYQPLIKRGFNLMRPRVDDLAKFDSGILVDYVNPNWVFKRIIATQTKVNDIPGLSQAYANRVTSNLFSRVEVQIASIIAKHMDEYKYNESVYTEIYMNKEYVLEIAHRLRLASEEIKSLVDSQHFARKKIRAVNEAIQDFQRPRI